MKILSKFFYCTSNLPVYLFKIMGIQKWLITKDERTDIQTLGLSGSSFVHFCISVLSKNFPMKILRGSHKCGRIDHLMVAGQTGADVERVKEIEKVCPMEFVEMEPGMSRLRNKTKQ